MTDEQMGPTEAGRHAPPARIPVSASRPAAACLCPFTGYATLWAARTA